MFISWQIGAVRCRYRGFYVREKFMTPYRCKIFLENSLGRYGWLVVICIKIQPCLGKIWYGRHDLQTALRQQSAGDLRSAIISRVNMRCEHSPFSRPAFEYFPAGEVCGMLVRNAGQSFINVRHDNDMLCGCAHPRPHLSWSAE